MSKPTTLTPDEIVDLDQFYREGGLRAMASPNVHYDDPTCPHPGCGHQMEWIDYKLKLHGDPQGIYKPLVTAWWDGSGFVGPCPACGGLIRFQTLGMTAVLDAEGVAGPRLPAGWAEMARIA